MNLGRDSIYDGICEGLMTVFYEYFQEDTALKIKRPI